jgi:hypothetical protein
MRPKNARSVADSSFASKTPMDPAPPEDMAMSQWIDEQIAEARRHYLQERPIEPGRN